MPLTPTYSLLATQVPAPLLPASIRDPFADPAPPLILHTYAAGPDADLPLHLNQDNRATEGIGRYGGGLGYAIAEGLLISEGTGLVANVAAGAATLDAVVVLPAAAVVPGGLSNGAQNYLWMLADHSLTKVVNSLSPAGAVAAYLGRMTTAGGVSTAIDLSGVLYRKGGVLFRRTADVGPPGDTPDARVSFVSLSQDAAYLWDGAAYRKLDGDAVRDHYLSGEVGYVAARTQQRIADRLIVEAGSRLVIDGRVIVG